MLLNVPIGHRPAYELFRPSTQKCPAGQTNQPPSLRPSHSAAVLYLTITVSGLLVRSNPPRLPFRLPIATTPPPPTDPTATPPPGDPPTVPLTILRHTLLPFEPYLIKNIPDPPWLMFCATPDE